MSEQGTTEQWLPVVGWEGFYEISDLGRVRSMPRSVPGRPGVLINLRGRILTYQTNASGYHVVALCRDNVKVEHGVHRLVLAAFVGPCPDGMECCHNDGNPANNTPDNLRWDTRSENTYDRVKHGTHSFARKTHCLRGHPFDETNTRVVNGSRRCITCVNAAKRDARAKAKAAS